MSSFIYILVISSLIFGSVISFYFFKYKKKSQDLKAELTNVKRRKDSTSTAFEFLLDHSSDFIFKYNAQGMITYVSSNA
ncbi:MAG: hypothetical protein ACI82Q_003087, partial [Nonlabens sp.]